MQHKLILNKVAERIIKCIIINDKDNSWINIFIYICIYHIVYYIYIIFYRNIFYIILYDVLLMYQRNYKISYMSR